MNKLCSTQHYSIKWPVRDTKTFKQSMKMSLTLNEIPLNDPQRDKTWNPLQDEKLFVIAFKQPCK